MGDIEIHVRGSSQARRAPERATVFLTVARDGAERGSVFADVARIVDAVRASLQALRDAGGLRWFAVDEIRVGSYRPWNADGEQLPPVHTASVSVTAHFDDLATLGEWVSGAAVIDGVSVAGIDWALTRRTRDKLERSTRRKALRAALRRAQDYADALDLGRVRARTVRDPGVGVPPDGRMYTLAMKTAADPAQPSVTVEPRDVEIGAEVEATFVVKRRT